jgi:hypothetical protein
MNKLLSVIFQSLILIGKVDAIPVSDSYRSNGTFIGPDGVTSIFVLVIGGGGGSIYNGDSASGGRADRYLYTNSYSETPGDGITGVIGAGSKRKSYAV